MYSVTRNNQRTPLSIDRSLLSNLPHLSPDSRGGLQRKRTTSRWMDHEPEALREEIRDLKLENKDLKQMNEKLIQQLKLDRKEQISSQDLQSDKTKNKLKQARLIIQETNLELDKMRKDIRFLKVNQLETQLQDQIHVNQRLARQIEELTKPEDVKGLQNLTQKLFDLEEKTQFQFNNIQKLKTKCSKLRWDLDQMTNQRDKYKKQLQEKTHEFDLYRKQHEQEILNKIKQKHMIKHLQEQIEEKNLLIKSREKEMDKLQSYIEFQKQQQLDREEQKYQDQQRSNNKKVADDLSQQQLDGRIQQIPKSKSLELEEHEESITPLVPLRKSTINDDQPHLKTPPQKTPPMTMKQSQDLNSMRRLSLSMNAKDTYVPIETEQKKIRYQRVMLQDVQQIGRKIRFYFISQNIDVNAIEEYFEEQEQVTIDALIRILQKYPFNLSDHQEAMLLARYLVEDNTIPIVIYNPELSNNVAVIKSVLKHVIGKYQLLTQEIIEAMDESIATQISKFRQSIIDQIKIVNQKKKIKNETCDIEDWKSALSFCNINLDQKQRDYIDYILFQQYGSASSFEYRLLLDKFTIHTPAQQPTASFIY